VRFGSHDRSAGTRRMYIEKGGHLFRLLGDLDVNALSYEVVSGYITQRLDEGAARSTVAKELITLRVALDRAERRDLFLGSIEKTIPKFSTDYTPKTRHLSGDEFRALMAELVPHRQLSVLVAVFTGGRYSEVASLNWGDVDFARGVVHLRGTKTARSDRGYVPLHPVLAAVLDRETDRKGPIVGSWPNARRDLAAACDRAGVERVTICAARSRHG
jgi:integrase